MDEEKKTQNQQFLLGLFGGIAVVAVIALIILGIAFINTSNNSGAAVKGETATDQQGQQPATIATGPEAIAPTAPGIITFAEKKDAVVCQEDGQPVVYLFSTTWCSHCNWIKDTFDQTMADYVKAGKIKAYHWELDTGDNTLTSAKETEMPAAAMAIYSEFNPDGSIPTFVFGCKYFRVGNGYEAQNDLAAEQAEFKAVIKDLIK